MIWKRPDLIPAFSFTNSVEKCPKHPGSLDVKIDTFNEQIVGLFITFGMGQFDGIS